MSVRALLLDDSLICRIQLREILQADGDIKVVGEGQNGDRVLELIEQSKPDLLLVDLEMPGTAGHATIERVMANRPLPILVVTGLPEGTRKAGVFESIRRGALELAAKPTRGDIPAERLLRAKVRQLAKVPVVRHVAANVTRPSRIPRLAGFAGPTSNSSLRVIGVGASAGGPMAMAAMLSGLKAPFGAAIAVVQHLPNGFTKAFAEFLQSRIQLPVQIVNEPTIAIPGTVFVAPDDHHLQLEGHNRLRPRQSEPVLGHRPSVDVLFHSLAREAGPRSAAVIMSGMGTDGVDGMEAMRRAGAFTVAQDKASSGVFGMPGAAIEQGAAEVAYPPMDIAAVIDNWARTTQPRGA